MNSVPKPVRYRHFTVAQYEAKAEAKFWSKIEKTDTCWLWTGIQDSKGYGIHSVTEYPKGRNKAGAKYRAIRAHRHSWELENGPIPAGAEIDHMCHNPSCVRPSHLRPATRKQNSEHRISANSQSKSGVRGVRWVASRNKWRATVGHNGTNMNVGYFRELADAEAAVIAKRNELHTHNNADRQS